MVKKTRSSLLVLAIQFIAVCLCTRYNLLFCDSIIILLSQSIVYFLSYMSMKLAHAIASYILIPRQVMDLNLWLVKFSSVLLHYL